MYKMASSLFDLLRSDLIRENDEIEFTFKNYTFRAQVVKGGLITNCTLRRPTSNKFESVLQHVSSFSSLTSWTESCLQDELQEYFTRYSSWKRVFLVRLNVTLGEIRDRQKILHTKVKGSSEVIELYREICRLQRRCSEMGKVLKKHNLFEDRWEVKPLLKINEEQVPKIKKRKLVNKKAFSNVQNLMLQETS